MPRDESRTRGASRWVRSTCRRAPYASAWHCPGRRPGAMTEEWSRPLKTGVCSSGYRINCNRGTQFRIWATRTLRDHLLRGYSLNERSTPPPRIGRLGRIRRVQAPCLLKQMPDGFDKWQPRLRVPKPDWILLREPDDPARHRARRAGVRMGPPTSRPHGGASWATKGPAAGAAARSRRAARSRVTRRSRSAGRASTRVAAARHRRA